MARASFNYCEVVAITPASGPAGPLSVRVRDALDGAERDVRARVVVNATGAWFERASATLTGRTPGTRSHDERHPHRRARR